MTTVSFRMEDSTKQAFDEFCKNAGLNITSALNLFVTKVLQENRIPFDITGDPFYSDYNQKILKQSIKELEEGKGTPHELIEEN